MGGIRKLWKWMIPVGLALCVGLVSISVVAEQELIMALQGEEEQQESIISCGLPSFITDEMILGALATQEEYGYPASVCVAQIIAESGFGRYGPGGEEGQGLSQLAYRYKNLFGIKGNGPAGSVNMATGEQTSGGENYTVTAAFAVYHSYEECIEKRAVLLTEVYSDLIGGVTDADTFAEQMGSRWATSVTYADNLKRIMQTYNLYRLDRMSVESYRNGELGSYAYDGNMTELMERVVEIARTNSGTVACEVHMCAAWVSGVYAAAGLAYPSGDAIDMWNQWKYSGSTDRNNIPPGAIVCGSGGGEMGARYGHVGIYLGNGLVANNNSGTFCIEQLDDWCARQTATCQGHTGWIGWVWPNGQALDR